MSDIPKDAAVAHFEQVSHRVSRRFTLSIPHLVVRPGLTLILGENGAGKSTFLRLAATASPARGSGTMLVLGRDLRSGTDRRELRSSLAYVPQAAQVPRRRRVEDFLIYAAWLRNILAVRREAEIARVAADLDLEKWMNRRLGELSGGTLRRVIIAQALLASPRLLLLDEPTAGLDRKQRKNLLELIGTLAATTSVWVSTHHDEIPMPNMVIDIEDGVARGPAK